jgi:hypothetical protein
MLEIIDQPAQVNIHLHPEWVELRTTILTVLDRFPAARGALVEALNGAAG